MILIVGLGNPGEKYVNNRHNVGFMFIDYLNVTYNTKHISQGKKVLMKKMLHVICYTINNIVLAKPQTFMNLSGRAVKKAINYYQLTINDLVVVHDDLDIPLGKFKIQKGIGPRLHNGIESIEKALVTIPHFAKASRGRDFWRVRIGVDNRTQNNWVDGETYVLQDFKPEEKKEIVENFPKILKQLKKQISFPI